MASSLLSKRTGEISIRKALKKHDALVRQHLGIDREDLTQEEIQILDATLQAVTWGFPLQETHRYYQLDTAEEAPANQLFKPNNVASWLNKNSAPAPNASVLYLSAWLDVSDGEQVLQLPANKDNNYYVWAILDAYINTVGSFGSRTQTKKEAKSHSYVLLCGPSSEYYKGSDWSTTINTEKGQQTAQILRLDTPQAWVVSRFGTDVTSGRELQKIQNFIHGKPNRNGTGFQITDLKTFIEQGGVPYQEPITESSEDRAASKAYGSIPTKAVDFFHQLGIAWLTNPIPAQLDAGIMTEVPDWAIWRGNQNSVQQKPGESAYLPAKDYQPPSALSDSQLSELNERFSAIGLNSETGFTIPDSWGKDDRKFFQKSYKLSLDILETATDLIARGQTKGNTNNWHVSNLHIGVYDNTPANYIIRSGTAIDGGAANIPNDAVYPTTEIDSDGKQLLSTYNYTINLDSLNSGKQDSIFEPVDGFWSYTIFQPNDGNTYQPFLIQNAISNTAYTSLDKKAVLTNKGQLKVKQPVNWNSSTAKGTAILTGDTSAIEGLESNTTYYVHSAKESKNNNDTIKLSLSASYEPDFNWDQSQDGERGVAIGGEGSPGPKADLSGVPGNSINFGWISPVAQLSSYQIDRPRGASIAIYNDKIDFNLQPFTTEEPSTNWIPTPQPMHNKAASEFMVMSRFYQPKTVKGKTILAETKSSSFYQPPSIERGQLNRIQLPNLMPKQEKDNLPDAVLSSLKTFQSAKDRYSRFASGAFLDTHTGHKALKKLSWLIDYQFSEQITEGSQLFFYEADSLTGTISGLHPGKKGYEKAAMNRRINPDTPIQARGSEPVVGQLRVTSEAYLFPLVITAEGDQLFADDRVSGQRNFSLQAPNRFGFSTDAGGNSPNFQDGVFSVTGAALEL